MTSLPYLTQIPLALFVVSCLQTTCFSKGSTSSYESINALIMETVHNEKINPELRPLRNQSDTIVVSVAFSLASLVEINDLSQKFVVNGFLTLNWLNQIIHWNNSDYGGLSYLVVRAENVWRPKLMLVNTVDDSDIFSDRMSKAFIIHHSGSTTSVIGGLFSTSCQLQLEKYPFDIQYCYIQFCTMGESKSEVRFTTQTSELDKTFFIPNRGWDLVNASIGVVEVALANGNADFSCPRLEFKISRRPTFSVLYVITPVLLLSFLNALVFIIPADSGEKISYGITVLLALSVYMSTISTMLPQASDSVPALTLFLFCILVGSVLAVAVSILTVLLHRRQQQIESKEEEEWNKGTELTSQTDPKIPTGSQSHRYSVQRITEDSTDLDTNNKMINGILHTENVEFKITQCLSLKCANKCVNIVCLVVFVCLWLGSSLMFFAYVMAT